MDERDRDTGPGTGADAEESLAFKALTVLIMGMLCLLTASWLVLISNGLLTLMDWLNG